MSTLGARVVTGTVAVLLILASVFLAPPQLTFFFFFGAVFWALVEFVQLARRLTPTAPLRLLYLLVPAATAGGFALLQPEAPTIDPVAAMLAAFGLVAFAAVATMMARMQPSETLASTGLLTLAVPYFAVPPLAVFLFLQEDPWLVVLLLAIVAMGDTMAFFIGRRFGRNKLAPSVSPNKTWEGSIGGMLFAVASAAVWAHFRLGEVPIALLGVAAFTGVAAQLGDLVESLFKRAAGIKDSSQALPGHGGFYDRLDATLFAAPAFLAGLRFAGL